MRKRTVGFVVGSVVVSSFVGCDAPTPHPVAKAAAPVQEKERVFEYPKGELPPDTATSRKPEDVQFAQEKQKQEEGQWRWFERPELCPMSFWHKPRVMSAQQKTSLGVSQDCEELRCSTSNDKKHRVCFCQNHAGGHESKLVLQESLGLPDGCKQLECTDSKSKKKWCNCKGLPKYSWDRHLKKEIKATMYVWTDADDDASMMKVLVPRGLVAEPLALSIANTDLDGDGDEEVLIASSNEDGQRSWTVYVAESLEKAPYRSISSFDSMSVGVSNFVEIPRGWVRNKHWNAWNYPVVQFFGKMGSQKGCAPHSIAYEWGKDFPHQPASIGRREYSYKQAKLTPRWIRPWAEIKDIKKKRTYAKGMSTGQVWLEKEETWLKEKR